MTVTFTGAKGTRPSGSENRISLVTRASAGPALIVAAVIVVLHGFVFQSKVSSQHPDVLGFWLPTYCFLGKSLAGGHIPAWNPHVMAGVPFAADPQSGWMYAPAMLLFSSFPCGAAIRSMIVLQPALGGVGLYGFLRSEGLSRPGATTGGLALALGVSASRLVLFLPFPSSFAWTAVVLWLCSVTLRARTWPARIGWGLLAAVAWGQLAAAYFSHGLILGTAALILYAGAKAVAGARAGTGRNRESLALLGLLGVTFVVVNLAFLLPRIAYVSETSYGQIVSGPAQLGPAPSPLWPLKLATSPGGYLGIAALVLAMAAPWSRRHRALVAAFGAYGALSYLFGVDGVAPALARAVEGVPVLDFYAHFPGRFSLGLFLAIPVLAAIGLDAWTDRRPPRQRALMVAPGIVVFLLLPAMLGAGWLRLLLPAFGAVAGAVALAVLARRPGLAPLVPAVLALELTAGGLLGQTNGALSANRAYADNLFGTLTTNWLVPLAPPDMDVQAYLRPGSIAEALESSGSRYMSLDPDELSSRGYLTLQDPRSWGLMANQRAMLFDLEDTQGYNPVQLARYWTYVRAVAHRPLAYNGSFFEQPSAATLDLLQVGRGVVPVGSPPASGWTLRAREGPWALYGAPTSPPRASALTSWRVVEGSEASLGAVAGPGFDPSTTVVLEEDPGLGPTGATMSATAQYRPKGLQAAEVAVDAPSPAIVLVRTPYARNWHATVDGRAVPILPADHLLQGVPVTAGRHEIRLTYDDPWIRYGLVGSLLSVLALLAASLRSRRAGAARLEAGSQNVISATRSG
jgi:membrane protein YfhO